MSDRRAVILAAGKGTRMNAELPKVLVPVCGRPMIEYVLDALDPLELAQIIVVVGYGQDQVRRALATRPRIQFVEQTRQLGTGHAVQVCRDVLARTEGPVFVSAGDSPLIQTESVRHLFALYEDQVARGSVPGLLLGTAHTDHPFGLGRILRDESGQFLGIVEEKDASPEQRLITEVNMSYYLFHSSALLAVLDSIHPNNAQREYYLTDLPAALREKGFPVFASPKLLPFESLGVNTHDDLVRVEQTMKEQTMKEQIMKGKRP